MEHRKESVKPMKPILKAAMVGLLSVAIAAGGLLGLAGSSFATSSAPLRTRCQRRSPLRQPHLLRCHRQSGDQRHQPVESVRLCPASTAADSGATKATLYFANPQKGVHR